MELLYLNMEHTRNQPMANPYILKEIGVVGLR